MSDTIFISSRVHILITSQTIVLLRRFAKVFACVFLLIHPLCVYAASVSQESSLCGNQLKQVIEDKASIGSLPKNRCPLSYTLAQWVYLQKPGATFHEYINFLTAHPDWPSREKIQTRAEQSLNGSESMTFLVSWFSRNPPLTAKGLQAYAKALIRMGKMAEAQKLIQKFWIQKNLTSEEARKILAEFKGFLKIETHRHRMDRLLMEGNVDGAKRLFYLLAPDDQVYMNARISLIQGGGDVDSQIAKLSSTRRDSFGLLYDRVKWCRTRNKDDKMLALLVAAPATPPAYLNSMWRERNLLTRRLMDDKRYAEAYRIVKGHQLTEGEDFANAEWLAGWIAFRLLNKPDIAILHFKKLADGVSSPISRARAYYWLGRTYQALGKKGEAEVWMAKARSHPGTYYGQMALKQGRADMPALLGKRPNASPQIRKKFDNRELVQAIQLLSIIGAGGQAEPFILKLSKMITDPAEQIFLIEFASQKLGSYGGVLAAKKSQQQFVPLIEAAFPVLPKKYLHRVDRSANLALVHSIIRQESRFKEKVMSSAGARGLMQMMPKTAQQTAQKTKLPMGDLFDPRVNVPLGCAHIKELLTRYNGSLVLSIAAYNAGAHAVNKWIVQYGDPRNPKVNLIDWIEWIPYAETRNYVQRVLENYAYYRQNLRSQAS